MREIVLSVACILAAIVSVQAGASLAKSLFPVFGPAGTTAIRLLLGSALLCALFRPWRDVNRWREQRALPLLLAYGASLGVMNLLFYVALRGLPLGIAVSIEFLGPLGVAVFTSRRATDLLWVALAVLGLALLLSFPDSSARFDPLAVLAALGAAAGWASYIVFGQRLGRRADIGAGQGVSLGAVIATALVLPGLAGIEATWLDPRWAWPALLVALLSTAIPYPLEMRALRSLPLRTFGILMSLEPAMAALAGWLVLGERLTATQAAAIAAVMAASVGTTLAARGDVKA